MSSHEVFKKFYYKLVESLPMHDAVFMAKLFTNNLLPGDLHSQVEAKSTSAEKAVLFLDCTIQPALRIGEKSSFMRLLKVMQEMDYGNIRLLAHRIKSELKEELSDTAG